MSKLRIVIADDESLTRMDIREMLEEAGYSVIGEACDGRQAIAIVAREKPDLVMLDIKMPVLDGIEATKAISDMGYPVLLLTAFSQMNLIERAKKVGALHYLVKPVSEREVLPAVEMTLALHQKIMLLRQEVTTAYQALEERKVIERACAVYAREKGISQDEAYRRLAKAAMNTNRSLYQVAAGALRSLKRNDKNGRDREKSTEPEESGRGQRHIG